MFWVEMMTWSKYEQLRITVAYSNIVQMQYTRFVSSLDYVWLIIHFNIICARINFSCNE